MKVHARFSLIEDTRASYWITGSDNNQAARIKMMAVKGEPFGPATPSGTIEMLIVNPDAIEVFRTVPLGTEFDVIISPVTPEE